MHKKLKIALRCRSSEQGFAIPIAMGLGLVMILIGTTMIMRSQGDRVTASAQTATNRGLSAAETGVTRYQSLINNNRAIALYIDCNGTRDSSGNCPDTGNTISWANAINAGGITTIPPAITSSGITSCSSGFDANAVKAAAKNTGSGAWQYVSNSDHSLGQYRLVSYVYPAPGTTGTTGVAPGTGQLTVEGRVNQLDNGTSASTTVGTATTQLEVNIPVQQGNITGVPFPGMWIKNSLSTGNTAANILVPCNSNPSLTLASGYTLSKSNFPMPTPPKKPIYPIPTISDAGGLTLPRPGIDLQPTNPTTGEYEYSVSTINGKSGDLTITPGKKVTIYLDGDIDFSGQQGAIKHQCTGVPNCSPTDAKIYGLSPTGQLTLKGNAAICDIFFLAPTYTVTLDGGGQAQGCGGGANTNGIYWVNSWNGGGTGNHTSLAQTSANWKDINFPPIQLAPQIAPITSWQRQEASP